MGKTPLTLILLAVLLAVAGCQYFPVRSHEDSDDLGGVELTRPEARRIANLLSYYKGLNGLGYSRLKTRLDQLEHGLEKGDCSTDRLKSAMVLSRLSAHGGVRNGDALLGPCLNNAFSRYSPEGKLALLLRDLIETRKAAHGAQANIETYQSRLKTLQEENRKLHEQLDGLRAIEKSIQQRNRH